MLLARTTSASYERCGELPDLSKYRLVLLAMENAVGSPFGTSMLPADRFLSCVDSASAMQYFAQGTRTFYAAYAYVVSDGGLYLKAIGSTGDSAVLYGIP